MNAPRTTTIEALTQVSDTELSLLAANLEAEGEYLTFYGQYALTGLRSLDEGSLEYATRLVFFNKKYRHDTKQAIADGAQQLLRLHSSKRTGENAHQRLKSIASSTLRACDDLYSIFDQKLQDWAALLQAGNERPTTRLFNDRLIKRVECIVAQVRQGERLIRQMLEEWGPCFEALCTEDYLQKIFVALRQRKLCKNWFANQCTPHFACLEDLSNKRNQIMKDVRDLGDKQLATWSIGTRDDILTTQVQSQIETHNRAEEVVRMSRELQRQAMSKLIDLYAQAKRTPATLPGPGGAEVPVERLCEAADQYDAILGLISKTYTIAKGVQDELESIQVEIVVVPV